MVGADAARERGIVLTSASKAFNLAGLKTALVITASDWAREAAQRVPPLTDRLGLGVIAAEAAFAHGDRWLDAVRTQLAANRAVLGELLAAELPKSHGHHPKPPTWPGWTAAPSHSATIHPKRSLSEDASRSGRGLDYGREGAGFVRLNFGTSPEHVTDAVSAHGPGHLLINERHAGILMSTMRAAGLRDWLRSKDPLPCHQTRCAGDSGCVRRLYFSLYVLDDTQMATFAAFGCIALGALSEVTGEPWERTKTYGAALLASIGLVSLGTALAVNTWAAVAGMLVVGFAIAYAGVGGPRVVGAPTVCSCSTSCRAFRRTCQTRSDRG